MKLTWLKLDADILDNDKIKAIRTEHKNGSDIFLLWIGLLCIGMKNNSSGKIEITDGIPFTTKQLSVKFSLKESTVKQGLATLERYKMVSSVDEVLTICDFANHQSVDKLEDQREQNRQRQAKHREKKKAEKNNECDSNVIVTLHNDIDKIREDKNRKEQKDITPYSNSWINNLNTVLNSYDQSMHNDIKFIMYYFNHHLRFPVKNNYIVNIDPIRKVLSVLDKYIKKYSYRIVCAGLSKYCIDYPDTFAEYGNLDYKKFGSVMSFLLDDIYCRNINSVFYYDVELHKFVDCGVNGLNRTNYEDQCRLQNKKYGDRIIRLEEVKK